MLPALLQWFVLQWVYISSVFNDLLFWCSVYQNLPLSSIISGMAGPVFRMRFFIYGSKQPDTIHFHCTRSKKKPTTFELSVQAAFAFWQFWWSSTMHHGYESDSWHVSWAVYHFCSVALSLLPYLLLELCTMICFWFFRSSGDRTDLPQHAGLFVNSSPLFRGELVVRNEVFH